MNCLPISFICSSLVRARVDYNGWDADAIQGCVCDFGFTGYDCSLRTCPYGADPLSTETYRLEATTLVCQASSGYFNIQVLGLSNAFLLFRQK